MKSNRGRNGRPERVGDSRPASASSGVGKRQYSVAFRRQVALFIRETEASVDDLSLALGVTANTVRSWLAALGDRKAEEGAEMRKFAASPILSSPTPAAPEVQQTAEREPE